MFVTTDPLVMAFTAGIAAIMATADAAANATHAGVHGALLPPAADPTAIALTGVHHFDHANYQLQAGLGTVNQEMIAANLTAGAGAYALTDILGSGLLG
jgi:hypothetical protein